MSGSGDSEVSNTFEYDPDNNSVPSVQYSSDEDVGDYSAFTHVMDDSSASSKVSVQSELASSDRSSSSTNRHIEEEDSESNLIPLGNDEIIVEENNNDPNNNLDDEYEGTIPVVTIPLSPQPGCSKHFDKVEGHFSSVNDDKIFKIADELYNLISKITRESIINAIRKKGSKNLTIFDMAPDNQTSVNSTNKRQNSDDICTVENKKASNVLPRTTIFDSVSRLTSTNNHSSIEGSSQRLQGNTPPIVENSSASGSQGLTGGAGSSKQVPENAGTYPSVKKLETKAVLKTTVSNFKHQEPKFSGKIVQIKPPSTVTSAQSSSAVHIRPPSSIINPAQSSIIVHNRPPSTIISAQSSSMAHNRPSSTITSAQSSSIIHIGPPPTVTSAQSSSIIHIGPPPTVTPAYNSYVNTLQQHHHQQQMNKHMNQALNELRTFQSHVTNLKDNLAARNNGPIVQPPKLNLLPSSNTNKAIPLPAGIKRPVVQNATASSSSKIATDNFNAGKRYRVAQDLDQLDDDEYKKTVSNIILNDEENSGGHSGDGIAVDLSGGGDDDNDDDEILHVTNPSPDVQLIEEPCLEIYQKLRAMFPDIEKNFIKKYCPPKWSDNMEHDQELSVIIDKLLNDQDKWVLDINIDINQPSTSNNNENKLQSIDETHEYLTGIFPDADPHFLRKAAEKFKTEDDLRKFVEETLKNPNYQTREQYMAKLKLSNEQKRYTDLFSVEHFLSIFPDPIKHFEDPKRICKQDIIIMEFLKNHFFKLRVNTISSAYSRAKYNLSLAAKKLRSCNDFMKSKRHIREILTEDISKLQEMAFVKHYDEIITYINVIKSEETNEFLQLKAANKLLTCQCCYDDECMPSKCSTCENGHIFCNNCIVNGTDSKLGDGETHVPCFVECDSEFSLSTLQKIIPPTKFSILLKKRQAAEVMAAGLEGLVSCPFCHFASIPPEGDKIFKCLNPECMKESCRLCKEPNHVPLRCDEVDKQDKARKYIEEKMTQALARNCYKCNRPYFKDEGCNKIVCPCGAKMCYLCNKAIQDYSHFRGQGSDDASKCPLWSDNQRLNAEIVRRVAEDAKKEILQQNANLRIDTERLQPALPPRTQGPHADILNADDLAAQLAARVMQRDLQ